MRKIQQKHQHREGRKKPRYMWLKQSNRFVKIPWVAPGIFRGDLEIIPVGLRGMPVYVQQGLSYRDSFVYIKNKTIYLKHKRKEYKKYPGGQKTDTSIPRCYKRKGADASLPQCVKQKDVDWA